MSETIIYLPKEKWKGQILPIGYTTDTYYDVSVENKGEGFLVELKRKAFDTPVTHGPEEYDFPDRLYEDHWEKAQAFGVVKEGRLLAAIETCPEEWSNRLRVTELWVDESLRGTGLGKALMNLAKEQAVRENRRAVILETQSCNVNAIGFYLHQGFGLIGFDTCCYSNQDLERGEVRIELGWFPTPSEEKVEQGR